MFERYPHESSDSALKRAIDFIDVAQNCCKMKKNECDRLKTDLRNRDATLQTKDDTIKALKNENQTLKDLLDQSDGGDISNKEEMQARNVENENIIQQLGDENEELKQSNAIKDKLIKSLKTENQKYKRQLSANDCKPSKSDFCVSFNGKLPKLEPKVFITDKNKPLQQRKRKALNDISAGKSSASKDYGFSEAIKFIENTLNNDSGIDLKLPDDFSRNITHCHIVNQNFIFNQKP
uniref:Uncharacterized protein n=1 Tax=Panagrolaimus superbus TaxID=310955 RepID=A0A914Y6M9_9BILA